MNWGLLDTEDTVVIKIKFLFILRDLISKGERHQLYNDQVCSAKVQYYDVDKDPVISEIGPIGRPGKVFLRK